MTLYVVSNPHLVTAATNNIIDYHYIVFDFIGTTALLMKYDSIEQVTTSTHFQNLISAFNYLIDDEYSEPPPPPPYCHSKNFRNSISDFWQTVITTSKNLENVSIFNLNSVVIFRRPGAGKSTFFRIPLRCPASVRLRRRKGAATGVHFRKSNIYIYFCDIGPQIGTGQRGTMCQCIESRTISFVLTATKVRKSCGRCCSFSIVCISVPFFKWNIRDAGGGKQRASESKLEQLLVNASTFFQDLIFEERRVKRVCVCVYTYIQPSVLHFSVHTEENIVLTAHTTKK